MTIEFDGQNNKLGTTTADSVTIKTNDTDALTVDSSQKIGIGTSSPSFALSVSSTSSNTITAINTASNVSRFCFAENSTPSNTYTNIEGDARSSGYMAFRTNDTEAMRIDSSGKVGIGDSSPESTLTIVESANNTNGTIKLTNSTVDGYATTRYVNDAQAMWVGVDGSVGDALCIGAGSPPNNHRLVVQPSGNVLIGTTSTNSNEKVRIKNGNDTRAIAFQSDSSAEAGYIYINSGGTSVSYSTSSDYRLKENVVDLTSATDRLKQLQPKRFNFIADADTTVDGFLAHEVSSIVPEAINGEKDELDADGNPVYQGIDQSKLVPLLTASLQEAIAKIEELETRLEALEKL